MSLSAGSRPSRRQAQIVDIIDHEDENYQQRQEALIKIADAMTILNELRAHIEEEVPARFGDQAELIMGIINQLYVDLYDDLRENYDTMVENMDEIFNPHEELTDLGKHVLNEGSLIIKDVFIEELNTRAAAL